MIKFEVFNDHDNEYPYEERQRLLEIIRRARADGIEITWIDYQAWMWATLEVESNEEVVMFKLKYLCD